MIFFFLPNVENLSAKELVIFFMRNRCGRKENSDQHADSAQKHKVDGGLFYRAFAAITSGDDYEISDSPGKIECPHEKGYPCPPPLVDK